MHDDQVEIAVSDVARAVGERLPERADEPVRPVASGGTVVALFRVGTDLVARLPLVPDAGEARRAELESEQRQACRVAPHLSVAVPEPVALCEPVEGYPGWWSLWRWLPGEPLQPDAWVDLDVLGADLATLVREIHGIPTGGRDWDGTGRGGAHLADRDDWVRRSIARSAHLLDTAVVTRVWVEALSAVRFTGQVATIHSDLMPGNLLTRHGRLSAVIDWGPGHVGDPAADLAPAWHLLDGRTRQVWRRDLGVDDDAWSRGRGWALEQAIGALHYYEHTNAAMFTGARRTLRELLSWDR